MGTKQPHILAPSVIKEDKPTEADKNMVVEYKSNYSTTDGERYKELSGKYFSQDSKNLVLLILSSKKNYDFVNHPIDLNRVPEEMIIPIHVCDNIPSYIHYIQSDLGTCYECKKKITKENSEFIGKVSPDKKLREVWRVQKDEGGKLDI